MTGTADWGSRVVYSSRPFLSFTLLYRTCRVCIRLRGLKLTHRRIHNIRHHCFFARGVNTHNKTARLPQSAVPVIHYSALYWHGSSRNALFRHVEAVKEDEIRLWFIHLLRLTSSSSVQSVRVNKTARLPQSSVPVIQSFTFLQA